jgi:hypothetical protein
MRSDMPAVSAGSSDVSHPHVEAKCGIQGNSR